VARVVDENELIEHWTLVDEEMELLAGRRAPTKLAFALMLKFHQLHGRFPRGRGELPDEAVEYVAAAVNVPAPALRRPHRRPPLPEWVYVGCSESPPCSAGSAAPPCGWSAACGAGSTTKT